MRVLHVIPTVALEHGGPSHAVRTMARALVERGVHVDVAATSYGTPEADRDPNRVWETSEHGVTYRLFPQLAGLRWNFSVPLTRWLFANVGGYDVAHVHAPFSYPTLPACAASRRARVPYLYRTIGALDPWSLRQGYWKKRIYYQALERRNLEGAYAVHVTSEAERDAIVALGLPREKVALIPLGIADVLRRPSRSATPPLRVLFVGRLHPKKGIPLLIDAVHRLRGDGIDVVLDIAGEDEFGHAALLRAQVERLGLATAVRFIGFVTGERKARLFADSHIAALPAYDENFGIAVAEAMAHGLPVVVSDGVGLASHVGAARAGRVCPAGDALALAQALRELLPAAEREACGARGAALVASEFSLPVMAERLIAAYLRATTRKGDGPAVPRGACDTVAARASSGR